MAPINLCRIRQGPDSLRSRRHTCSAPSPGVCVTTSGRRGESPSVATVANLRVAGAANLVPEGCAATSYGAGKSGSAWHSTRAARLRRELGPASRVSNLVDLIPMRRPEDVARWVDGLRRAIPGMTVGWSLTWPHMALFGLGAMSELSPLSGVKRKSVFGAVRAAFDPTRTSASISCCSSEAGFTTIKVLV